MDARWSPQLDSFASLCQGIQQRDWLVSDVDDISSAKSAFRVVSKSTKGMHCKLSVRYCSSCERSPLKATIGRGSWRSNDAEVEKRSANGLTLLLSISKLCCVWQLSDICLFVHCIFTIQCIVLEAAERCRGVLTALVRGSSLPLLKTTALSPRVSHTNPF